MWRWTDDAWAQQRLPGARFILHINPAANGALWASGEFIFRRAPQ